MNHAAHIIQQTDKQDITHFSELPDLANRLYNGSVICASDELYAEKENLIKPEPPESWRHMKGNRGGVYDGWETRRRYGRQDGHDWVVVRLGLPGIVYGIEVDTAFFKGNYPASISVEACSLEGNARLEASSVEAIEWEPLVPVSLCEGDRVNYYPVQKEAHTRYTHVRLHIYPDGGVARLRVYGVPLPDPAVFAGLSFDLAALENGGLILDQSDKFFQTADNVIAPVERGWETRRRRTEGHDWFLLKLTGPCVPRQLVVNTIRFLGNSPESICIQGCDRTHSECGAAPLWRDLLPRTPLYPDTVHRFPVREERPVTHLRVQIFPDGGLRKLHVLGCLTEAGREAAALDWFNALPQAHCRLLLTGGVEDAAAAAAEEITACRPYSSLRRLFERLDAAGVGRGRIAARMGLDH